MRVLFVDDDEDLRAVFTTVLASLGHECSTVASYEELIGLGEAVHGYELAILDINLGPGEPSGIDAFEWLRRRGFAGAIVFLTGHGRSHPLVTQAEHIGLAQVLQKPISIEQLAALLARNGEVIDRR